MMKMNLEDAEKLFRLAHELEDEIAIPERVMSEAHAVIVAAKDALIAELEKERDEAVKDSKTMAGAANLMMHMLEHKDYPDAIAIMEKYK